VCVFLPFVDTFTIYGKCCLSPGPLPQERRQASGRSSPSNPLKVTFATHQKQKRISPKKKPGDLVETGATNMRYPKLEGLEKVTIIKGINYQLNKLNLERKFKIISK